MYRHLLTLLQILLCGLGFASPTWAGEDFLLPDQAFRISGQAEGPEMLVLEWRIADGYYLYRDKFKFTADTPGIDLGPPRFPTAETKQDEFFGEVKIYRHLVAVRLPVKREPGAANTLTLNTKIQGCADKGFCFPPHAQVVLIELPPPITAKPPSPAPTQAVAALAALDKHLGLPANEDGLLEAEQAFRFSAEVAGGEQAILRWQVAKGTYLYRDKISVRLPGNSGVSLKAFELPPGQIKHDSVRPDGSVGDVEVYSEDFELPLGLLRAAPGATTATLDVQFQGCAEIGICYPPRREQVKLLLPALAAAASPAPTSTAAPAVLPAVPRTVGNEPQAEQDRIAATLVKGSLGLILASFFGFGLLLAFTPCVFPMIPILSGIIAGQGRGITPRRAFLLSLVYVLAMALTYTLAGVLAGLFGQNLQASFQNPWLLAAFAGIFVALALSMFGFFELQLPSRLQTRLSEISNRQQGGTLLGVAVMGLLSALIVGPCVAPPLAGALIYIGQTGDGLLGGTALFALSLGMGAPLLLIGTSAGKWLPRAGGWMDQIKAVFGVLLLAVAITLVERILPPAISLGLWGGLLITASVYMGALAALPVEASGWAKLWKGLGVTILVYGALMLVGAAAGGKDTLQPLRGLTLAGGGQAEQNSLHFKAIKSTADLERELAAARTQGQAVMLDFYADWCVSCKELERYTFPAPEVRAALARVVLLRADVTANDAEDKALLQGRFGLPGPPAILFFDLSGQERTNYRLIGFKPAAEFAAHAKRALP